ncbi:MAG: hypothetical protein WCJ61_16550 [Paludibacter sp.]
MEWEKLSQIVGNQVFKINILDYLYLNKNVSLPIRGEMSAENLYYVSEVYDNSVTIQGVITYDIQSINLLDFNNNWWIKRRTESISKLLQQNVN